jgi:thiol:disulfide interchange protein
MKLPLKKISYISFLIFILIFSGCISKEVHGIKWEKYEHGMEKAEDQNKTVLIYFYLEHCPGCRMLERNVLANETVIEKSREFICIKINVEEKINFGEKYNVTTFPTVLFIKSNEEVNRIGGYIYVEKFLEEMQKALMADPTGF